MGWLSGWTYRKKITNSASSDQATWQASTAYSLGAVVRPTTPNGFWYQCETAGTSGSSEPTWPTTDQSTVTDGTVTWRAKRYYQVPFLIGESSGASGYNLHLEGKSAIFPSGENQGGDLRFTASDGSTLLDFWVESVSGTSPNRLAKVWVEVPGDLSQKDIYCYFGNASATNASNGSNAFLFFEDASGDLSKWTVISGTWEISSGEIKHTGAGGDNIIKANITPPNNLAIHYKAKLSNVTSWPNVIAAAVRANTSWNAGCNSDIRPADPTTTQRWSIQYWNGSNWVSLTGTNFTYSANTYYSVIFKLVGSSLKAWLNDANLLSATNSSFTSGLIVFRANCQSGQYGYLDTIFVRNATANEPAFSSAGALETFNLGAMLLMFLG